MKLNLYINDTYKEDIMSREQTVEVTIKADGTMSFEMNGFIGNECDTISQIEEQIGVDLTTEDTEERSLYEIPDPQFLNTEG